MADFDPEKRGGESASVDRIFCASCNRENKLGATFCAFCATFMGDLEDGQRAPEAGADALDGMLARTRAEAAKKAQAEAAAEASRPKLPSEPPASPRERPASSPGRTTGRPASGPGRPASAPGRQTRPGLTGSDLPPITSPGTTSPGAVEAYRRRIEAQAAEIDALKAEREDLVRQLMADDLDPDGPDGSAAARIRDLERLRAAEAGLAEEQAKRHELTEKLLARIQEVETLREAVALLKAREAGPGPDLEAVKAQVLAGLRGEIEIRSKKAQAEVEAQARRAALAEEARDQLMEQVAAAAEEGERRAGEAAAAEIGELTRKLEAALAAARDAAAAAPASALLPESLKEDLCGVRMLVELLASKAAQPEVVANIAQSLLADLDKLIGMLG